MALHGRRRLHPDVVYRFDVVRQRFLSLWRHGDEKAGIVPARRSHRRNPVAEVGEAIDRELQAFLLKHFSKYVFSGIQSPAVFLEASDTRRITGVHELAVFAIGEQYAGLLERLTDCPGPIRQTAI